MITVKVKVPSRFASNIGQEALTALSEFARSEITRSVFSKLGPLSGANYLRGLSDDSFKIIGNRLEITLKGEEANSLEDGFPSYDIKAKMLPKATKFTKAGDPIVDVPFKHGTPGAKTPPPMPRAEYNIMRQIIKEARGMPVRGPREMPTRPVTKKVGESGHYTPKAGPYDSMLHDAAMKFHTLRRISKNSDPLSWIHPGRMGVKVFDEVKNTLETMGPKILKKLWERANGT